jgi:toxin ParE1/3/4
LADKDLVDIFQYSADRYGIEQAVKYLKGIEALFTNICVHPHLGRQRDEVKLGLRSHAYFSHTIFYRISDERIIIVRVLHASRDSGNLKFSG